MGKRPRDEGAACPIGKCRERGFHFREEAVRDGKPMTNWHCPDGTTHLLPRDSGGRLEEPRPAEK
ncbi:MAG TPA: hypothetical protein VKH46_06815 [Thermoanaerobaculia bacterium]|nr:hypothetical protein [Thermoanaerobaculia bacterium]